MDSTILRAAPNSRIASLVMKGSFALECRVSSVRMELSVHRMLETLLSVLLDTFSRERAKSAVLYALLAIYAQIRLSYID